MFAIEVQSVFCAAHALRLPGGGGEPLHGHNFHVTVKVTCTKLDALETVIDFHLLEKALADILAPWTNQNLNDIEPFKTSINPTAERIAEHIGQKMSEAIAPLDPQRARQLKVVETRLTEAANCLAIWTAP